jgi:hypothetical protein
MMPDLKPVQLHDQPSVHQQLFILGSAVTAGSGEHMLVPLARRLDIRHGDHRLGSHGHASFVSHGNRH